MFILKSIGELFIPYPYLALIPAILFAVAFFKWRRKLIGLSALLWLLYMIYETLKLLRITCSGECNIRVDLFLIYPVLIISTVISLVLIGRNLVGKNK